MELGIVKEKMAKVMEELNFLFRMSKKLKQDWGHLKKTRKRLSRSKDNIDLSTNKLVLWRFHIYGQIWGPLLQTYLMKSPQVATDTIW